MYRRKRPFHPERLARWLERIKATLDQCLVTDEEWGYAADGFPDPLP
ncbi:hypothetical protein CathTA2_1002 [Caldalkalibacillus thermarum TA2.A1]|uniref:Uncharacterized protein n=1 Tax=Caldalkalibacillus thermarum (strain TA2.A1) TaxID=986075 RepID=F5L5D9_CALTT|nr:hypothetical protein [Caldalkalibacillus thermarum]EGL83438.1 hypothetical protein CathTA2_1002 [Caldalkalibacillus thermarum TA2.A1]QZT34674.1 hypothetical protein HUR95_04870 [Caldalkalibacillus thermarum TA2.A1]